MGSLLELAVSVVAGFAIASLFRDPLSHHAALAPNQPNCLAGDPNCKPDPKQPSALAAPIPAGKAKAKTPAAAAAAPDRRRPLAAPAAYAPTPAPPVPRGTSWRCTGPPAR